MPTIADKGLLLASLAGKYLGGLNQSDSCSGMPMKSPPSCWKGGLFSSMRWTFILLLLMISSSVIHEIKRLFSHKITT